jgi:type IV pilus assembly protein PilM
MTTSNDSQSWPEPTPAEELAAEEPTVEKKVPFYKRHVAPGQKEGEPEAAAEETVVASSDVTHEPANGNGDAAPSRKTFGRGGRGRSAGKRWVGLKVGASQLSAAVVAEREGRSELVALARTPLEPGVVVDGEVRDAGALTQALRKFFADNHLPTRDVRIGLASNRIGVRTFDITGVDDSERFDNAVRFKAHEVLPVAVHESVLDYRVLSESSTEAGEAVKKVLLVVAPRDQVEPYVDVCSDAGLRLAGADLEALGLLRAFIDPRGRYEALPSDRATVVIAIGHESSTLLVAGGGVCEFTRVFDWGGAALADALVQELGVSHTEAVRVLHQLSLSGTSKVEGLDEETRARALEAVRLRLTPFARELVASLQFYQTQPDSLGIGEIVITGGTSHLGGLADALNQIIGVPVRVGDPLGRVTVRTDVRELQEQVGSLAVAIGLAIDDERSRGVDLLPREEKQSRKVAPASVAKVLLPVACVVPVIALGAMFMQARGDVNDRETQLTALETEFASLPKPKKAKIDPALQGEQAQRATAVAQVLGSRLAWDNVLRDLSKVLPGDVWLTGLRAQAPALAATPATAPATATPGAPVTPTGVTITGYTFKADDVAELVARIGTVPTIENVQLQSAIDTNVGDHKVVQFTILADMRGAGR